MGPGAVSQVERAFGRRGKDAFQNVVCGLLNVTSVVLWFSSLQEPNNLPPPLLTVKPQWNKVQQDEHDVCFVAAY